jgi:threonine/homoserine efflux transporter RhtA
VILSSIELAAFASLPFTSFATLGRGVAFAHYPNAVIVTGVLAYGSWFLLAERSALGSRVRVPLAVAGILGFAGTLGFALLTESMRPIDYAGSFLFAGACWAFGIAVAERFGVDLFRRDAAEEEP